MKECRQEMAEPIHYIIECSIKTGKVSQEWKRAEIMPIDKNGNKEPLNYRTVSLNSIVCKICEKIIKKQWTDYLEREGILSERQFGFRTARSCVINLVSFYIKVIDSKFLYKSNRYSTKMDGWIAYISI